MQGKALWVVHAAHVTICAVIGHVVADIWSAHAILLSGRKNDSVTDFVGRRLAALVLVCKLSQL